MKKTIILSAILLGATGIASAAEPGDSIQQPACWAQEYTFRPTVTPYFSTEDALLKNLFPVKPMFAAVNQFSMTNRAESNAPSCFSSSYKNGTLHSIQDPNFKLHIPDSWDRVGALLLQIATDAICCYREGTVSIGNPPSALIHPR